MNNFETLHNTSEETVELVQDTKFKARIHGVATHISMFDCVYGNIPGEMVLMHADNQ